MPSYSYGSLVVGVSADTRQAMAQIGRDVSRAGQQAAQSISRDISQGVTTASRSITDGLGRAMATVEQAAARAWEAISSAAGRAAQAAAAAWSRVGDAARTVTAAFGRVWDAIASAASRAADAAAGAWSRVGDAARAVTGAFGRAWDNIASVAGRAANAVAEAWQRAVNAIPDSITGTLGRAWESVSAAAGRAATAVGEAWSRVVVPAGQAIQNGLGRAWESVSQAAGRAATAVGEAWSRIVVPAGQAIQNGLGRAWDSVAQAAGRAATSVADAWSRVVTPAGEAIMNGLGRAWENVSQAAGRAATWAGDAWIRIAGDAGPPLINGMGRAFETIVEAGRRAADNLSSEFQKLGPVLQHALGGAGTIASSIVTGLGAASAAVAGFGVSAFHTAARVGSMDAALGALGKQAGITKEAIDEQTAGIRSQGIEYGTSQTLVAEFMKNQLDLADATDLARVAQDFAVISNKNSSEVLDDLIHGISTQNSLVLRNAGTTVQAGDAMDEYAKSMGKTRDQLTASERAQAVLNAVMEDGEKVAGAYADAMEEPGKVLTSYPRIIEWIKVQIGSFLVDALGPLIIKLYNVGKAFAEATKEGGALQPIMEAIRSVLERLAGPIGRVLDKWKEWLEGLNPGQIQRVAGIIERFGPLLIGAAGAMALFSLKGLTGIPVVGQLLGNLTGPLQGISSELGNVGKQLVQTLPGMEGFGGQVGGIVGKLREAADGGSVFAQKALGMLGPMALVAGAFALLMVVSPEFRDAVMEIGRELMTALKPALDGILEAIKPLIPVIVDLVQMFGFQFAAIIRDLTPLLGPIVELLGVLLAEALRAIVDIITFLMPVLTFLVQALGVGLRGALFIIVPLMQALVVVLRFLSPLIGPLVIAFIAWKLVMGAATILQLALNAALWLQVAAETARAIAMGIATAATWLATAAATAFGAVMAFLTSPIGIVIAAIVLLGAILTWMYFRFDWFRNIVDTVWRALQTFAGWIAGAFIAAWRWLGDALSWVGERLGFVGTIARAIGTAMVWLWDKISGLAGWIGGFFIAVWDRVVAIFKAVWRWIVGGSPGLIPAFRALAEVAGFLWRAMMTAWNLIRSIVLGAITGIFRAVGTLGRKLWDAASGAARDLWNGFSRGLGNVGRWIYDKVIAPTLYTYGTLVPQLFGKAVEAARGLWDGFLRGLGNVGSWINRHIIEPVVNGLRELPGKVLQIGKDVVEGFMNGLRDIGTKVADFFKDKIPGPIKKVLGIESPSRLFMEFGQDVMAGFMIGLESRAGEVEETFQGILRVMQGGPSSGPDWAFRHGAETAEGVTLPGLGFELPSQQMAADVEAAMASMNEAITAGVAVMVETITQAMAEVLLAVQTAWELITLAVQEAWEQITLTIVTAMETLGTVVQGGWEQLTVYVVAVHEQIHAVITGTWESIVAETAASLTALWLVLSGSFDGWLAYTRDLWANVAAAITGSWEQAIAGTVAGLGMLWTVINSSFDGWLAYTRAVWAEVAGAIAQAWDAAVAATVSGLQAMWVVLSGSFDGWLAYTRAVWTELAGVITSSWDAAVAGTRASLEAIWQVLNAQFEGWLRYTRAIWDQIRGAIADSWDQIARIIENALRGVLQAVTGAWDEIARHTFRVWGDITGFMGQTWDRIFDVSQRTVYRLRDDLYHTWNVIERNAEDAWNRIVSTIERVWENIKRVIQDPVRWVTNEVINKFIQGINGLLDKVDVEKLPEIRLGFARGGKVPGAGTGDTVPAMLAPGEWVLTRGQAQRIGYDTLAGLPHYQRGGLVGGQGHGGLVGRQVREAIGKTPDFAVKPPHDYQTFSLDGGLQDEGIKLSTLAELIALPMDKLRDDFDENKFNFSVGEAAEALAEPYKKAVDGWEKFTSLMPMRFIHAAWAKEESGAWDAILDYLFEEAIAFFMMGGDYEGGAGIDAIAADIMNRFPGLRITSALRPGDKGYHGRNWARDLAGPVPLMASAAQWVQANLVSMLLEGIFNPGLSIKNYQQVPSSYWGPGTWAGHADHLHLAADPSRQPSGGGGGAAGASRRMMKKMMAGGNIAFNPGGGAAQWRPLAEQVIKMLGAPPQLIGVMLSQIQSESGGNPRAINNWDINAKNGTPSMGLLQVIQPTFDAYAGPMKSRGPWDPMANLYAALNYALSRYGAARLMGGVWGSASGYARGGVIREPVFGFGQRSGRPYTLAERGPELVSPLRRGRGRPGDFAGLGAGDRRTVINVYPQPGQDERAIAAAVSRELAWAAATGAA